MKLQSVESIKGIWHGQVYLQGQEGQVVRNIHIGFCGATRIKSGESAAVVLAEFLEVEPSAIIGVKSKKR
jgi:hypothetical protein